MHPPAYFEEVRKRAAQRWDQLENDPDLAAPWHQLFKQVQSPRHVVSELLQNADDAGATRANVLVDSEEFVFSHNGEDFKQQHFSSLCRFGYSNKRALHTIGFRGIGFKSTFSLGDEVRLQTPTLSVGFRRKRFTEPYWLNGQLPESVETTLRVTIQDEPRKTEIAKNLSHWLQSPASLLFFRSLRYLRIGDDEVIWQSSGAGPVTDSEWVKLSSEDDEPVLLVRSALEDFPEEAIEEIRQERMLSEAEEATLPPCKVEIVLGLEGRLFVVLPTGVKTSLPFACNAPFVQDPARVKIKDPETSPTNRWLLERVGRLAAQTMLTWLRRDDLTLSERAAAYGLLSAPSGIDDSIEGACSTIIAAAFYEAIRSEKFLLTDSGQLVGAKECVSVPPWLSEVWSQEQVAALFDAQHRPLFPGVVESRSRALLVRQGYLAECTNQQVLEILRDTHLPRPKSWSNLLTLWAAVAPCVTQITSSWQPSWKTVRIVPVQGQDCLYSAQEVVRLGEKRLLHSDDDWEFLSRHMLAMNPNWGRFLAEQRRTAESTEDTALATQVQAADNVMQAIGLGESSDASKVMIKIAAAFFEQDEVEIADCVRLAHIAAALAAKVSPQFEFVTRSGTRTYQSPTTPLVADKRFDLDSIVHEDWCNDHTLHSDYWADFTSCTANEWEAWLNSGQSGLLQFIPLELKTKDIYGRHELRRALQGRGVEDEPGYPYVTSVFVIEDWDFAGEHWQHWEALALDDNAFWAKLLVHIFEQPTSFWNQCLVARVLQIATTKSSRALDVNLLPAWILKLRSKACLQDTWGHYREPADLLRRTPNTESLLDVEPFIRAEMDTEAVRPLLARLGVRDTPTGPRRLLERLQALATVNQPPVYEVQKWCHRIDAMLPKCSTQEFEEIKDTFNSQKLILTSDGTWARTAGVFLNSDENHVPGSAVIHNDLRSLTLWQRIGVAERPTIEIVLAWLKALPTNERPAPDELRRIKEILPKHPYRIWAECGCWLNLEGEWISVDELSYSISMQSLSAWSHLFSSIKRQVADFTRLPADVVHQPPFSELPSLGSRLQERVQSTLMPKMLAQPRPWLTALGNGLSRIVTDSVEKTERIRKHGDRLSETIWQTTALLETVPFLDGIPAGTARPNEVLWEDRTLFVEDRPLAKVLRHVARELARPFDDSDVEDAIKFCVDRSDDQVTEYLEQNFTLAATATRTSSEPKSPTDLTDEKTVAVDETDEEAAGSQSETAPDASESKDVPASEELAESTNEAETIHDPKPPEPAPVPRQTPIRPRQLPLIERFAQLSGFKKDVSQDRFYHTDGRWLQKESGMTFPWEMYLPAGELLKCFFVKEHCITQEPLQIGADVWEACRRNPSTHVLLMTNADGSPLELPGQRLLDMKNDGLLILHPATYRLVYQPDEVRVRELG